MVDLRNRKMKVRDAAKELGVAESTISRYMDRGELDYLWIGGRRILTRGHWEDFLKSRTMTGPLVDSDG